MADVIDGLNLMSAFSRFVPALLVLVVVYALMLSSGKFGKNQFVNAVIALTMAAMVLMSDNISGLISFIAPWFVVLFMLILFMLIAFKSTGVTDSMILSVMKTKAYVSWTIVFIIIAIVAYGISQMFGQNLLTGENTPQIAQQNQNLEIIDYGADGVPVYGTTSTSTDDFDTNLENTLFHPAILGLALIGLIAAFTTFFMVK